MSRIPIPDVTVIDGGYAKIRGLYNYAVTVRRLRNGDFEMDFDDSLATFDASQLAQFAELLRRMAAGEPIKP